MFQPDNHKLQVENWVKPVCVLPVVLCKALRSWTPWGPSYTPSRPGRRGCSGWGGSGGRRPWSPSAGASSGSAGTGPAPRTPGRRQEITMEMWNGDMSSTSLFPPPPMLPCAWEERWAESGGWGRRASTAEGRAEVIRLFFYPFKIKISG